MKKVEDEEIAKLVKKEVEHGLPFITDGEFLPPLVASGLAERVPMDLIQFILRRKSMERVMKSSLEQ